MSFGFSPQSITDFTLPGKGYIAYMILTDRQKECFCMV